MKDIDLIKGKAYMDLSYQERKAASYYLSNFHANLSFSLRWALPDALSKPGSFREGGGGIGKMVYIDLETNISLERGRRSR